MEEDNTQQAWLWRAIEDDNNIVTARLLKKASVLAPSSGPALLSPRPALGPVVPLASVYGPIVTPFSHLLNKQTKHLRSVRI